MNALPKGWVEVKLRDVAKAVKGRKPAFLSPKPLGGLVPYLDVRALETGEIRQYADSESSRITDGTEVAVLWDGARSGWAFRCQSGALGSTLIALRSRAVDAKFLLYVLRTHYQTISDATHGSGIPHIDPEVFWELPVPLPPFAEQRRIADAIEQALNHLANQRQELELLPGKLSDFRQSILADAFSGKLTAEWRRNRHNDSQINSHTEGRYSALLKVGNLPALPQNWRWQALGDFASCKRGRFSARPRNDPQFFGGSIPFIQIGDFPPDGGWITHHKQTLNDKGLRVSKLFPKGTAVIAIVGATIGNTGLLGYDMCFPDSIVGIQAPTHVGSRYVELYLRSQKTLIREAAYGGGGQPNISLETLNPWPIPLPPTEEQAEIVHLVDSQINAAEKSAAAALKIDDVIETVIKETLARAFRGELVPQDPNDEPAEILLARVNSMPSESNPKATRKLNPGQNKMTKSCKLSPESLTAVLLGAGGRLSSTELFRLAGFDADSVDEFYEVLKKAVTNGTIKEVRPNRSESFLMGSQATASSNI